MFFDTFSALCGQKGVSPKKAVTDMGLSNSLATAWKKRNLTPKGDTLNKIADYFGVSVDFLLGNEKTPAIVSDDGQREIDEIFKKLSPDNRSKLLELANLYLAAQRNNEGNK